jgi:hypothetical protein
MSKPMKPADALPLSLPPRGLSRVVAAGYLGISTGLFDQMVADGRMPQPKVINSRKVWDRLAIDRHFDELGEADDGDNSWDDVSAGPIPDREESQVTARQAEQYDYPRTPEEWQEHMRLWCLEVIASPLLSRELMGLAGLYEVKSERIKRIRGVSINTMERLLARGFVEADGDPPPGKCASYKITAAGEKAWEALPEARRKAVTFTTRPPFQHEALSI